MKIVKDLKTKISVDGKGSGDVTLVDLTNAWW